MEGRFLRLLYLGVAYGTIVKLVFKLQSHLTVIRLMTVLATSRALEPIACGTSDQMITITLSALAWIEMRVTARFGAPYTIIIVGHCFDLSEPVELEKFLGA